MPIARFQMPDGRVGRFEVPDGTSPEQAQAMIQATLAPKQQEPDYSPTRGMSWTQKFLAGAGKAGYDLARGAAQTFGFGDQAEIDAAKKRDAALMDTGAGIAGNITGNVAALLPAALIPGANTYAGAAAIGAGSSLLNPVASDEGSVIGGKLQNAAMGGAVAPVALGAGRALAGAAQGAKALVEPFYKGGQENIVGRTLSRFSDDPAALAARARGAKPPVPGVQQTLAEATLDPGAATLQRAAQSADPQIAVDLANRGMSNNAALVDALRGVAGGPGGIKTAMGARENAVQALYDEAKLATVPTDPLLEQLLKRPAIAQAAREAQINAANRGGNSVVGQTVNRGELAGLDAMSNPLPEAAYVEEVGGELAQGGRGRTLLQELRKMGGVPQEWMREISGETANKNARAPVGLFNKSARNLDDSASSLHDQGWIPDEEMSVDGGVQWLKDAIRQEMDGVKVYALHDAPIYRPTEYINNVQTVGMGEVPHYTQNPGAPVYSGKALHELKLALDAAKDFNPMGSANKAQAGAVGDASKAYNAWLDSAIPSYGTAKNTYAEMSVPINQMQIAKELLKKAGSPVPDAMGNPTLFPASYHRALNSDADLAKAATGFRQPLAKVLSSDQMETLQGIGKQLQAQQVSANSARSVGSNTAQNLAAQNLIRQFAGPLGFSEGAASSPIAQSVIRPVAWAGKAVEPALQKRLAEALMNPKQAADLMDRITPSQAKMLAVELQRYLPGIASAGLRSNAAQ